MSMNPVLQYAIEHQVNARAVLYTNWGIPPDDVEDVCQYALMRLVVANPKDITYPASYWFQVVRTAALDYLKRRCRQPPTFNDDSARDREDPAQDLDHQAEVREALRQASDVCRAAPAKERAAVTASIRGEHMDNAKRQQLHRLRKRLRAAAV